MKRSLEEKSYEALSPFELKNKLISMAQTHHERMMLNAGRGNPNWVAINPRQGFFYLGLFALGESQRKPHRPGLGGTAEQEGISKRFEEFVSNNSKKPGVVFLDKAYKYVCDTLKMDSDEFISEMVDAILGDHYPTPDRMLTLTEQIVHKYIEQEMLAGDTSIGKFDLFATEGGTAAMDYIFSSLLENKILHKGDKIALGTPIFTPYIEIPRLNDYELVELEVKQDENSDWQYSDEEIEKLADPAVKAFFLVNPSNPTSVSVQQETLDKITELVTTRRKDLIVLTDDVYGTFVNGFKSLAAAAPHNTILVYSFSKYFGATGWRLGVIGIHEDNIFDKRIAALPEADRKELHQRYSTVELDPDNMKFIDRMVAEHHFDEGTLFAVLSCGDLAGLVSMGLEAAEAKIDKENPLTPGKREAAPGSPMGDFENIGAFFTRTFADTQLMKSEVFKLAGLEEKAGTDALLRYEGGLDALYARCLQEIGEREEAATTS